MFGLKTKQTMQSFWQPRLEGMFSGKNEPGWDALKASFHDPALNDAPSGVFYAHMQAMTIQIVSMVITKSCSMETAIASQLFVDNFLESNNHKDVGDLVQKYNSAFGSSSTDGIQKMAELFSAEIADSHLAPQTVAGFHETLYGLVQPISVLLEKVKLVE